MNTFLVGLKFIILAGISIISLVSFSFLIFYTIHSMTLILSKIKGENTIYTRAFKEFILDDLKSILLTIPGTILFIYILGEFLLLFGK